MKTQIQTHECEIDDLLRRYIFQSIQTALSTVSTQIKVVCVKLTTRFEHSGDSTKLCSIQIMVHNSMWISANSETTYWLSTIDRAVQAAARATRREINRPLKIQQQSLLEFEN